jgi:hypothetical protein
VIDGAGDRDPPEFNDYIAVARDPADFRKRERLPEVMAVLLIEAVQDQGE